VQEEFKYEARSNQNSSSTGVYVIDMYSHLHTAWAKKHGPYHFQTSTCADIFCNCFSHISLGYICRCREWQYLYAESLCSTSI